MDSVPDSWAQTPWERDDNLAVPMLHKSQVPYLPLPNKLQHLDVWIPAQFAPQHGQHLPPSSWLPEPGSNTLWVIFIHGGAWRDPFITSEWFILPTLKALPTAVFNSRQAPIAFVSISYTLSPYPLHQTHPTGPPATDYSRSAQHPQHILDVLSAISYLQQRAGFGSDYLTVGHSCGATLAFQAAMSPARWGVVNTAKAALVKPPAMILGLHGLYAMPELVANPGGKHDAYKHIYEAMVRNAFGDDCGRLWESISPASIENWADEWPAGSRVRLVQSRNDSMVPFAQAERMRDGLARSKSDRLAVDLVEGSEDHDEIWQNGAPLADLLVKTIADFTGA